MEELFWEYNLEISPKNCFLNVFFLRFNALFSNKSKKNPPFKVKLKKALKPFGKY